MRRRIVTAGVAAILLGAGLVTLVLVRSPSFQKWYTPPVAGLPDDSEIESMTAVLYESQVGFQPIPEFTVPLEQIPQILFWFRPSKYQRDPTPIHRNFLIGELRIHRKEGETIRVTFYDAGHNPPVFTTNGADYFFGGGITKDDGHAVDGGVRAGQAIQQAYSKTSKAMKK